jgi:hypothetical protein
MSCDEVRERLPWLWNGTLGETEREAVEGHLDGCGDCWGEWEQTQWLGEAVAHRASGRPAKSVPIWFALAAALAALALGVGWWFEHRRRPPPGPIALANVRVSDALPADWAQRGVEAAAKPVLIEADRPVLLILAQPVVAAVQHGRLELVSSGRVLWTEPNPRIQAEGDFTVLLPQGLSVGAYELRLYTASQERTMAVYRVTVAASPR